MAGQDLRGLSLEAAGVAEPASLLAFANSLRPFTNLTALKFPSFSPSLHPSTPAHSSLSFASPLRLQLSSDAFLVLRDLFTGLSSVRRLGLAAQEAVEGGVFRRLLLDLGGELELVDVRGLGPLAPVDLMTAATAPGLTILRTLDFSHHPHLAQAQLSTLTCLLKAARLAPVLFRPVR